MQFTNCTVIKTKGQPCVKRIAETNTINQYLNIHDCYSIHIQIFADVIYKVLGMFDSLYDKVTVCVDCFNKSVRCLYFTYTYPLS